MLMVLALAAVLTTEAPDYAALYAQGVTYPAFLDGVSARADDWQRISAAAAIAPDAQAAVSTLAARRRLLVVAEAACSDSVNTIPYLAKLVEASAGRLEMRIVDGKAGRVVMEAHRAPDGRAATPTVVILDEAGAPVASWTERPGELQRWYDDARKTESVGQLQPRKMKWYADDGGKTTVADILALLVK